MTPHPQMKGKYKTFFCQLSSFVWVEEPCALSPQNSVRKNQMVLGFLALAIWSLRKDTASVCGSLQILLCASCTEEQDPSMILCCLTSHSAVRLYTLYAHGLKNSNIHSPEKLLVPSNERHLFFSLASEEHFLNIYLLAEVGICYVNQFLCCLKQLSTPESVLVFTGLDLYVYNNYPVVLKLPKITYQRCLDHW